MMMLRLQLGLVLFLIGFASIAGAEDSAGVIARAKAISGGELWDAARSWRGEGTLAIGGLSGEFHVTVDLVRGRSADAYKLGSVAGADGYDGARGWERDPGGEVAALDAPEAVRRARSQAWLDARAYWFPQRIASILGKVEARTLDGHTYRVLHAT